MKRQYPTKVRVWTVYIDSTKTRKEGRRIPKSIAVDSPQLHELEKVAHSLGLKPIVDTEAVYPRVRVKGALFIEKAGAKSDLLKKLAKKIREMRGRESQKR